MHELLGHIDHLVYVTPDVEKTIEELFRQLGVRAVLGGRHPAWGTRNALFALGPNCYFEIMGADESLSQPGLVRPFGIDSLKAPRLASWACKAEDLEQKVKAVRMAGVSLGEMQKGERTKPDSTHLSWQMTDLTADREGGIVPFFINWAHSAHPASDVPGGCRLMQLAAEHPEPDRIRAVLSALGLEMDIKGSPAFRLKALIDSPKGLVELQ